MGAWEAVGLALLGSLTASGLTATVRALVPVHWLLEKPWGCPLCMAFWTSQAASLLWWLAAGASTEPAVLAGFWAVSSASIPGAMLLTRAVESGGEA